MKSLGFHNTWSSSSPFGLIVFLKTIVANAPPLESNASSLVPYQSGNTMQIASILVSHLERRDC